MSRYLDRLRRARAEIEGSTEPPNQSTDGEAAARALKIFARLRGYVLPAPAGRIAVAREMAIRLRDLDSAAQIAEALERFEIELIELGGQFDPALAEVVGRVTKTFPGSTLLS